MLSVRLSFLLIVLVTLSFISNGCNDETDSDLLTTVRGTVTDSVTGLPLANAEIYLDDTTTIESWYITDSTGRYGVASFGYARWTVFCLVEGYQTKSRYVRSEHNVDGVDFEMAPE